MTFNFSLQIVLTQNWLNIMSGFIHATNDLSFSFEEK